MFLICKIIKWPICILLQASQNWECEYFVEILSKANLLLLEWQCGCWAALLIFGKHICHCLYALWVWSAASNLQNKACELLWISCLTCRLTARWSTNGYRHAATKTPEIWNGMSIGIKRCNTRNILPCGHPNENINGLNLRSNNKLIRESI